MFLLTIDPPLLGIWRWCSGFAFVTQTAFLVTTRSPRRMIPPAEFQAVSKAMYYSVATLASVAMVLQLINIVAWNRFWPFFSAIFVQLIASIAQFVRMVLLPHNAPHG